MIWANAIESKVFSIVQAEVTRALKAKFPDIYLTDSDRVQIEPKFPTVYVNLLSSMESGQDLTGSEINAGLFTFQLEVTHNNSRSQVREVMDEIVKIMKKQSIIV